MVVHAVCTCQLSANSCALSGSSCGVVQGDRRAGPSFSEFNYESTWGQKALKASYAAIMQVR